MGTRADFYIGTGEKAEWLGSIAWDGYPEGIAKEVREATTEEEYRKALSDFFKSRDDATLPEMGWPWPWNDSNTTDHAYTFVNETVKVNCFGSLLVNIEAYMNCKDKKRDKYHELPIEENFPGMSERKNVRFDEGSGIMILGAGK